MQLSSFLPTILTKLSQFALCSYKNPQNPELMRSARTTSLIAALNLGLAAAVFYVFNKAQQQDQKGIPLGVPKEKLAACGLVLLSPPAVGLASQAQALQAGYRCMKTGHQKGDRKKIFAGAFVMLATYATTTGHFAQQGGALDRGIAHLTK